jgi:hypothetical protein
MVPERTLTEISEPVTVVVPAATPVTITAPSTIVAVAVAVSELTT